MVVTAHPAVRGLAQCPTVLITELFEQEAFPTHVSTIGFGKTRQMPADGRRELGALCQAHGHPEMPGKSRAGGENAHQPAGDHLLHETSIGWYMGQQQREKFGIALEGRDFCR